MIAPRCANPESDEVEHRALSVKLLRTFRMNNLSRSSISPQLCGNLQCEYVEASFVADY